MYYIFFLCQFELLLNQKIHRLNPLEANFALHRYGTIIQLCNQYHYTSTNELKNSENYDNLCYSRLISLHRVNYQFDNFFLGNTLKTMVAKTQQVLSYCHLAQLISVLYYELLTMYSIIGRFFGMQLMYFKVHCHKTLFQQVDVLIVNCY